MERVQNRKFDDHLVHIGQHLLRAAPLLLACLMVLLEFVFTIAPASAGPILMAPSSPTRRYPGQTSKFPESRFGAAPANPVTGRIVPAPGVEADEWDAASMNKKTRRPASVGVASDDTEAAAYEDELRKSAASQKMASGTAPVSPSLDVSTEGDIRRKGVQEFAVIASDLGYFPKTIFANVDTPIRFYVTGASKSTLCVIMDAFQVRRQVTGQKVEEITFTASTPGRFRFYCPVNGMEGTLVVKEPALQLAGETGRYPANQ